MPAIVLHLWLDCHPPRKAEITGRLRKNWLFAGSDKGGHRAATIYSLVETAKLNRVDPEAWLRVTIARIADHPQRRIDELLPWNYRPA